MTEERASLKLAKAYFSTLIRQRNGGADDWEDENSDSEDGEFGVSGVAEGNVTAGKSEEAPASDSSNEILPLWGEESDDFNSESDVAEQVGPAARVCWELWEMVHLDCATPAPITLASWRF
jgi:hypothetical protein